MTTFVELVQTIAPFFTVAMLALVAASFQKDEKIKNKFVRSFQFFLASSISAIFIITNNLGALVFIIALILAALFFIVGIVMLIKGSMLMTKTSSKKRKGKL